jgi:hypothetical protein
VDELVRWLGEQLDEDERIARAATPGPWVWTPETDVWDQNGPTLIREGTDEPGAELVEVAAGWGHDAWGMYISEADQTHIARHDPARVLREIEAKRAIVARYEFACREAGRLALTEEEREVWVQVAGALQSCVLCLAVIYAGRPGYDEAWRP